MEIWKNDLGTEVEQIHSKVQLAQDDKPEKHLALGDVWYLQRVKEKRGQFLARLEESLWELFPAVVCAAFSCKYTHEKFP